MQSEIVKIEGVKVHYVWPLGIATVYDKDRRYTIRSGMNFAKELNETIKTIKEKNERI